MSRPCILLAFAAAAIMMAASGCHRSTAKPGGESASETPRVHVTKVARKPLKITVTRPGHIEAFEQTALFSKVEGYVGPKRTVTGTSGGSMVKDIADIGDVIKKDEVLAEIEVPELLEEYEQEKALLAQAKAGVEQTAKSTLVAEKFEQSAKAQIAESESGLIKAEGALLFAKSEYERISELAFTKSVPKQLKDEKLNQLKSAEAAKAETTAKIESVKAAHAEAQAKVEKARADQLFADAQVKVAQARVGKLKATVEYTQIKAPYDGIVTERNINTGDFVRPPQGAGKPLYVVTRNDKMRVFVDVPETEAALVKDGDEAEIQIPALKNKKVKGPVTRNSGALDPASRTLKTEIDLPNKQGQLLPGMYVVVQLTLEERTKVLVVPAKSVVQEGNKTYCFCIDGNKVVRREVTVGLRAGDDMEIISGLTGDETVVRDNAAGLKDGQTVEVVGDGG